MDVQVLISSCNVKKLQDLDLKKKNIKKAVIVNQFMPKYSVEKKDDYIMYSYNEKGLSKSRNRLIENSTSDIVIISDDDISFVKDYEEIVSKAYEENDADIIIFNMKKGNNIVGKKKRITYNKLSVLSVCSCQITFKRNSILEKNIKFDENFGIGSTFISGEENIFLKTALDNNLKIIHIPITINSHPDENTTGEIWTHEMIKSKGALMYRLYSKTYLLFLLYFTITKYSQYKENFGLLDFISIFDEGKNEYKKINE